MSLDRIIKTLEGFGLNRIDADVYVYLAKKGPLIADEVASALKLSKNKVFSALRNLQNKGIVTKSHPAVFSAINFEDFLDFYVKLNIEKAQTLAKSKEELLASWRSVLKQNQT